MKKNTEFTCTDRKGRKLRCRYLGKSGDPQWPYRVLVLGGTDPDGHELRPQAFDAEKRWFTERGVKPPR